MACAIKGSQKYIQKYVNDYPSILSHLVMTSSPNLVLVQRGDIRWVSPLRDNDYEEYRDKDFLKALGLEKHWDELKQFWPNKGPQWDALATVKTATGPGVILLEAKSHLGECGVKNGCGAKDTKSIHKINSAMDQARYFFGIESFGSAWTGHNYQICNRLAHLYFFNEVLNIPTWLVWFLVTDDPDWPDDKANAPTWRDHFNDINATLGFSNNYPLKNRVVRVYAPPLL